MPNPIDLHQYFYGEPPKLDKAIEIIRKELSPAMIDQILKGIDDPDYEGKQHFGVGLWVRNTLRENGIDWNDIAMDSLWYEILRRAVGK